MRLSHYDEPSPAYELARATEAWEHSHCEFNRERLKRARWVVLCQRARLLSTHAWVHRVGPCSTYCALSHWYATR